MMTSSAPATILIADDDRAVRKTFEKFISDIGYRGISASDGCLAWEILQQNPVDVCLLDLGLPSMDGMKLLENIAQNWSQETERPSVIVVSARDDMHATVQALKLGAYDYLLKPVVASRIKLTVQRALQQRRTSLALAHLIAQDRADHSVDHIIGKSEAMRDVYKRIGAVAGTRATVLIRGESGTGKELVARAIHQASCENNQPFVALNCTAFAPELLESELFGHVRGAFTGAISDKVGRFELALGGTLFLDEIGELRPDLQAKLLRVLQQRTFERVGDSRSIALSARVITATHRDLEQMLTHGTFREDLYYRLHVVEIMLPPLRQRKEDIPLLVNHLLTKVAKQSNKAHVRLVSSRAMDMMIAYHWPGNVRELENALTRAVVLSRSDVIDIDDLPIGAGSYLAPSRNVTPNGSYYAPAVGSHHMHSDPMSLQNISSQRSDSSNVFAAHTARHVDLLPTAQTSARCLFEPVSLRELERTHIQRVLQYTHWNKRQACAILQIARPTLDRKIREYQIQKIPELS